MVCSVIVTLLVLETGVRVLGLSDARPTPPLIYQTSTNSKISYELKPSIALKAFREIVTTNELGFRSPSIVDGKPLVAVLGDSMTFGYGLKDDETLPRKIEEKMEGSLQLLNAAVPGYTIGQEVATYEEKLAKLNPAALIVVFYWNDLELLEPAVLAPDGNIVAADKPWNGVQCSPINEGILKFIPGRCWLDLHSALYRGIRKFVTQRTGQQKSAEEMQTQKETPFVEAAPEESLRAYARELNRLPKNLPKLFVIWPDRALHQTYRPKLRTIAEARGFTVVDLYDEFGNEAETLSWDTVHPSAATVYRAAQVISSSLSKLLPSAAN